MGPKLTTPLSLTLDHLSEVQEKASYQGVEVRKKKWITFCTAEWVMMDVGWPRDGTFNLDIISQVEGKVFAPGPHGHPDQGPYIAMWSLLATDPPPLVHPFMHTPSPSPTAPLPDPNLTPLPNPATSSLYPTLTRQPEPPKKPAPVLPLDPNTPLRDLLAEEQLPYLEDQERERERQVNVPVGSPIAGRLRERREQAPQQPSQALSLREGPSGRQQGRLREKRDQQTSQAFPLREGPNGRQQYWPFSASDLYNWKQHIPPFSKDPIALTNLIESILVTQPPIWDDCQQLLQALLTSEERQRVFLEARKVVPGDDGRPTQLPNEIEAAFPSMRPNWDFTTAGGREHLRLYRQLLLAGLRGQRGAPPIWPRSSRYCKVRRKPPQPF